MKQFRFPFVNIGTSSIVTILVLLCLVTFASLSALTVRRDSTFLDKEMSRKKAYLQASNQAQEEIGRIDQALKAAWEEKTYDQMKETYEFAIPVDDDFVLQVEMVKCQPDLNQGRFYRLTKYKETLAREWKGGQGSGLIDIGE